jgi:hypothetical protein
LAYDYLGLVNDVNKRLNEVELSTSNFASAIGFYSHAKDSVNSAIKSINQQEIEWPFNHNTNETVLVPGQVRYTLPALAKSVDWDTFRIKRDNSLNTSSRRLSILDYDEYLQRYVDAEYDTGNDSIRMTPRVVFRTPDMKFGVYPAPDKAYSVVYESFNLPTDLIDHDDVPTIPEQYRHVIVDGAMYYCYMFRSDNESAQLSLQKFNQGIKDMRVIAVNRQQYVRSTFIQKGGI